MSLKATTNYIYDGEEMLANPVDTFEAIRKDGDVVWCPAFRRWIVLSKAAVLAALSNPNLIVINIFESFAKIEDKTGYSLEDLTRICDWIPFLHDGPRHYQLRALFSKVLIEIREDYLNSFDKSSQNLIKKMLVKEQCDFAEDYSDRLHVETIGRLANFSDEDIDWITKNSSSQGGVDFAASVGEMLDANQRAKMLTERVDCLTENLDKSPLMNILSRQLIDAGIEDNIRSRTDFVIALMLLGRDTISGTLTVGIAEFLDQNDGVLVSEDWSGKDWLADEFIRMSSTVQHVDRVAVQDIDLCGQKISKGDALLVCLPAANRDPSNFSCPHSMSEENGAHFAFGSSRHRCTGKPLTKKAIDISFRHLSALAEIRALPGRQLDDSKKSRKYKKLPVTLTKYSK